MKFEISGILSAFQEKTIGSKVIDVQGFFSFLKGSLLDYDSSFDSTSGQHFVRMPAEAFATVSTGDGLHTHNPDDYVVRNHRGEVGLFLKRNHALPCTFLAVVVYTKAAYLADPDVGEVPGEEEKIRNSDCSHVIVAVIAASGPASPLSPHRLVYNLAGGNKDVESWDKEIIIQKAKESKEYWTKWCVVAD